MQKDGRARGVKWVKKQGFFTFKACKAYGTRLKRKGGHLEKVLKSRRPEREDQAATIHGRDVWRDERSEVVNCDHCE